MTGTVSAGIIPRPGRAATYPATAVTPLPSSAEAESREEPSARASWCLDLARLHTALAQVAATALNSDGGERVHFAGYRFSSIRLISHS